MSWVAVAVVGATTIGGVISSNQQADAARSAAGAQTQAAQAGIAEQRRQFDFIQELLAPYIRTGETALTQQQALLGLGGEEAQQSAIEAIEESPEFQALTRTGEEAILQRASATGGLRGGNVQRALSEYRPQVLSGLINQQYQRLGGLTNLGQASAVGVGAAGQQTGTQISNLLAQQGAAQAGQALAQGQAQSQLTQSIAQAIGTAIPTIAGIF